MTTYPIAGSRRDRLVAWLTFNGLTLQTRRGHTFVRVARSRGRRPMNLWLHDNGRTASLTGDRKSHRSMRVERLMRQFNRAELYLPGASNDLAKFTAERLADKSDVDLQTMVDYYAARPAGLEMIGVEDVRIEYNARKRRTVEHRYTAIVDLVDLVTALGTRQAYLDELEARDRAFTETAPTKCSLPAGPARQLSLFAEVA